MADSSPQPPPPKHTDLINGSGGAEAKTTAASVTNVKENGTAHDNGRTECDNKMGNVSFADAVDDDAASEKVDNNANRANSSSVSVAVTDDVVDKSTSAGAAVVDVDVAAMNGTPNTTEFLAKNKEVSV